MSSLRCAILFTAVTLIPAFQPSASAQTIAEFAKLQSASIADVQSHAEAGDADAEYELGERYYAGKDVSQDFALALKWALKAAQQGHSQAQYNAGELFLNGQGTKKNEKEAFSWIQKSANQGNPNGQDELAMMYEKGIGVKQDEAEAVRWYTRAADQGLPIAQFDLAYLYESGIGTKADVQKALELYEKASAYVPTARHNLASIYFSGSDTVEKNVVTAYKWQLLAVSAEVVRMITNPPQSHDDRLHKAIMDAMSLGKLLSQEQKEKARHLAEEWINSNASNLGPEPQMYKDSTKDLWDKL